MVFLYDILILGGGIAGLTAAVYGARAGLSTAVVEAEGCGGQAVMAHTVENYPGFSGSGADLSELVREQAEGAGAQIIYDEISKLRLDDGVKCAVGDLGKYEGRALILAMGAKHRKAGFLGEEELLGAGVSYCAVCDGAFFKDKAVAVIGGADSAVSEALYLSDICKKVYLLYRRDKLRAGYTLVKRLEEKKNIEVVYNTVALEAKGGQALEKLITNTGELDVDGVFVAAGLKPRTEIVKGIIELDEKGYIKTDDSLMTSSPGVFAAGDIRVKTLRQIITAAADGALAAESAAEYLKH